VWSFGTMLCGLSHTFTQIFGARALVGAGEAALVPGNQSILADTFPPDRLGFPISIYSLGSKFGQGGSLIIGGFLTALIAPSALIALPLLGDLYGWQVILVVVGAPGLLLALLVFAIPEPVRRNRASPGADPVGYPKFFAFMKENARFFTGIIGGGTMASVAVSAIMAWTPTYFIRLHDMSFGEAGYWLGLAIMIGPVIGLPLHGLIADRLFRRGIRDAHLRYLVFACLLGMPLLAGAFVTSNTVLALIVFSIGYTLFHAFAVLGVVSLQLRVPGDMRGKAASISLVTTSIIGLSLGPVVTAWISEGLFNDPMMIGYALGACAAIFLPLTALFYSLAMKPIRTHLEAQERALA
nr:MFS transporter [Novosphingobium sp.]